MLLRVVHDDVVVGAWEYGSLGMVSVFHGDGVAVSPVPTTTILGVYTNGAVGTSVASAGDVDGDGFDDVIVGSGGGNSASLYHGGAAGLSDTKTGGMAYGAYGSAYPASNVASAGDVNGDGYDDVLHGLYETYSGTGHAELYYGHSSRVGSGTGGYELLIDDDTRSLDIGLAVVATGDFDANGYADIAIGCHSCDSWDGEVFRGPRARRGAAREADVDAPDRGDEKGVRRPVGPGTHIGRGRPVTPSAVRSTPVPPGRSTFIEGRP